MSVVRTRFAPSPTGILHLGGLRTALFNFLFARQNGGQFVLRIEDTDRFIHDALAWTQLVPDEGPLSGGSHGPYVQSQRLSMYNEATDRLLAEGRAYRCFCSSKRLEMLARAQRVRGENPGYDRKCRSLSVTQTEERLRRQDPFMIRFKLDDSDTIFNDKVFGKVQVNLSLSESDPVLMKSDGMPVYHLANVVDDHLMEITHVIRGTEWLPSTPKHILLYEALDWRPPTFAHVPLLLSESGKKLSKRNPDFEKYEINAFRDKGFLPETLLNWLLSCGGGFSADAVWEAGMRLPEMIEKFKLDRLAPHSAQLDFDKLQACGRAHFDTLMSSNCGREAIRDEARKRFLISAGEQLPDMTHAFAHILPQRIGCYDDLKEFLFLWLAPDAEGVAIEIRKLCEPRQAIPLLRKASEVLTNGSDINNICPELPRSIALRVLRLAIFGAPTGPPVSELVSSLTPEEASRRVEAVMEKLS